jgi:hypothetical protein
MESYPVPPTCEEGRFIPFMEDDVSALAESIPGFLNQESCVVHKKKTRPQFEGTCPSCSKRKRLPQTMNRLATAVAVLADPAALLQFERFGVGLHAQTSFRVCGNCSTMFKSALRVAREETNAEELQVFTSKVLLRSFLLERCFSFENGNKTLVSLRLFPFFFEEPLIVCHLCSPAV